MKFVEGAPMIGREGHALIEIERLTTGYGKKQVLHDVCLTFAGGAAGLVGPNGAGKTTLLRTILGFLAPFSGHVSVAGFRLPESAISARARIGYMPETDAYIPKLSAVQFVAYMGELAGLPRAAALERAHEVLDYAGVREERYRNLDTFSTGMKQRVKLAQAIVHDPALLLLDEPTSGMDPTGRSEMLDLIRDLVENREMNVILSTHLLNDVENIANEIIILSNGRVVSRKLRTPSPKDQRLVYMVRLRGDIQRFSTELARRGGAVLDGASGQNVYVELLPTLHPDVVFEAAHGAGCIVQRLEPVRERIEEIVLAAMTETSHAHL